MRKKKKPLPRHFYTNQQHSNRKMVEPKKLYICSEFDDLEKKASLPNCQGKRILYLLETANKLLKQAENYDRIGDQELAYIFYLRYFGLIEAIRKNPQYEDYRKTVVKMLGGNEHHSKIMDRAEMLGDSLRRRYGLLNGSSKAVLNNVGDKPIHMREYGEPSASEEFDRLATGFPSIAAGDYTTSSTIECDKLFELTQLKNVLIMDCRASKDYELSHIRYAWSFNVPEENIIPGMSAGRLQETLDDNAKKLWSARSVKDHVVLMDWNTKTDDPPSNAPIAILRDILKNWDPDVTYRSPIKILKGGYEVFVLSYPMQCSNPTVKAPQSIISQDDDFLDDIEYPSISDITMKDEIKSAVSRPTIDRSSKLAAIRTYEDKQSQILELKKKHDELWKKAKENDEKVQLASEQWHVLFQQPSLNTNEMTAEQRDLRNAFLQLESAAEDYRNENIELREELEKLKREKQEIKPLSPKQEHILEETTKEIEEKMQAREMLDKKYEHEKELRDQQLALARQNKPQLQPTPISDYIPFNDTNSYDIDVALDVDDDDPVISVPNKPLFDRSIKPTHLGTPIAFNSIQSEQYSVERHRDFSPEFCITPRGLTGLKNLGNTCYMNSIIQCLSNTPQLAEFCISNNYQQFINRKSKTQGEVVEELAALIKELWSGKYKSIAAKDLRATIGRYKPMFRGFEQQDSHEFLTILMDMLHLDLQNANQPNNLKENINPAEKAWLEFTNQKESVILRLFYGQIKSTVKCSVCEKESATYESFSNLSLELPAIGINCPLKTCLDMYFSGESIQGWNCPNCKQKRNAIKKLDISKLPSVLVIHLKRFYANTDSGSNGYQKKNAMVRFPLEELDMLNYITKLELRQPTKKVYQLYAVSNHYGSMEAGHYTAFCKNELYNKWFKFDDSAVSSMSESNVNSSAAYILFYSRLPSVHIKDTD